MGEGTHSICTDCWNEKYPGRQAVRFRFAVYGVCCFCGDRRKISVYIKEDGKELWCRGTKGIHKKNEGNKPVQPVVGEELAPPIKIDISAIPMKRERVG